jgi:hypothetical protein
MIFLQDDESKQQFLVDTSPAFSILPHPSPSTPSDPSVSGADGRDIPCWGWLRCCLTFGLRTFFVTFLLTAVSIPVLGLDFLSAHMLLVFYPVGCQVLDSQSRKALSEPQPRSASTRLRYGPC